MRITRDNYCPLEVEKILIKNVAPEAEVRRLLQEANMVIFRLKFNQEQSLAMANGLVGKLSCVA